MNGLYETDSIYTAMIENESLEKIVDNTAPAEIAKGRSSLLPTLSRVEERETMAQAKEECEQVGLTVTKQKTHYYLAEGTNQKYFVVLTEYQDSKQCHGCYETTRQVDA